MLSDRGQAGGSDLGRGAALKVCHDPAVLAQICRQFPKYGKTHPVQHNEQDRLECRCRRHHVYHNLDVQGWRLVLAP